MKKTILILLAICIAPLCYAQPFQKGKTAVNVGIGLGTSLGGLGESRAAISDADDHGLWENGGSGNMSFGGYLGDAAYGYNDLGYPDKWDYDVAGDSGA